MVQHRPATYSTTYRIYADIDTVHVPKLLCVCDLHMNGMCVHLCYMLTSYVCVWAIIAIVIRRPRQVVCDHVYCDIVKTIGATRHIHYNMAGAPRHCRRLTHVADIHRMSHIYVKSALVCIAAVWA